MPIYEYRCVDCNSEFEMMQKFSDPPLEQCPSCSGQVHKLISRSAFHLKGSGWYVTDYARQGSQNGKSNANSSSETKSTAASSSAAASADKETTKTSTAAA